MKQRCIFRHSLVSTALVVCQVCGSRSLDSEPPLLYVLLFVHEHGRFWARNMSLSRPYPLLPGVVYRDMLATRELVDYSNT